MPRPTAVLSHSLRIPRPSRHWFATIAVVRANRLGAIAGACRIVYAAQRAAAERRPPAYRVPGPADHQHESRQGSDCLLLSWRAWVRAAAGALQADAHRRSGRPRAVADHDQERDRLGPEARSEPGIGVDVDLDDLQPSGVPVGEVLEHGRARSARSAPHGARVNDDGHRGARLGIESLRIGLDQPWKLRFASRANRRADRVPFRMEAVAKRSRLLATHNQRIRLERPMAIQLAYAHPDRHRPPSRPSSRAAFVT
jgi:hypothetical protein